MTGRGTEIWLADLVHALDRVGDDPATRHRVARLLGFAGEPTVPEARPVPFDGRPALASPNTDRPIDPPAPGPIDAGTRARPPQPPDPGRPGPPAPPGELPTLTPVQTDAPDLTNWDTLRSLDEVTDRHLSARPPLEPLLTKRSSAAILNAALTTLVRDDGEPDIDALVDSFARGLPLTRLPRAARPTLRFGVQILVDLGDGMQPYHRDQENLVRQITGLVGAELTQARYFADVPSRGAGPGGRRSWQPYRTPSPGTRVLIVSDLGIGGPLLHPRRASVAEWHQVLDEIDRAGCTALALVPYPVDRVPTELTRRLAVLTWDRTTTVSTVAALAGRRS